MTRSARWIFGALGVLCLSAAACIEREAAVVEPHIQSTAEVSIQQLGTTKVDLLFVIDDSNSMAREQDKLSGQIEDMVRELIRPSDPNARAVEDLHIGIVSTDMGTGGYAVQTCDDSMSGDNGALQNGDRGIVVGCQPTYSALDCDRAECPWLSHSTERPDDDPANAPIWEDFACIATLGTEGCGFEQQLEASLAALTVRAEAGQRNEGFLRDDSLIAIIYVTDEDDCSTGNPELFNSTRDEQFGPLNTRCAYNRDQLYPVDRYVQAFKALRPGREHLVVVAAIAGVPTNGSWNPGDPLSALEEMVVEDPARPETIQPSCSSSMGDAVPPTRFVELVYAFGNNGVIQSICNEDWRPALLSITNKIQERLLGTCMPTELASTASDTCSVIETLHGNGPCPDEAVGEGEYRTSGWRETVGIDEDGNRVCRILPADYDGDGCPDGADDCATEDFTNSLQGWFYDNDNADCPHGRVRFTGPNVTANQSTVVFECRTARCPRHRACAPAALKGAECDPNDDTCDAGSVCVRHTSGEVCGWNTVVTSEGEEVERPRTCARCSLTLAERCESWAAVPEVLRSVPLVDEGGCCAEGFHCEDSDSDDVLDECVPNRTTDCD